MLASVRKVMHLLLIVVLIKGNFSYAYYSKGPNMAAGGCNAASNGKPLVDDSLNPSDLRKLKLGARKMAFDGIMRLDKIREIGLYEGTWITPSRASSKENKKASLNVIKGQQNMRSLLSKKKELAGFGAFTADYKGPMHHPPKNN